MSRVLPSLLLVLGVTAPSCAPQQRPGSDTGAALAFVHAAVVDVRNGELLRDQTVLIRGNRISAVGPNQQTHVPPGARIIDAQGKYLIPGLIDTHIHLGWDPDSTLATRAFRLFLVHGVTTIREVGTRMRTAEGPQPQEQQNLAARESAAAGALLSPRLWVAGRVDAPAIAIAEAASARDLTRRLIQLGVDGIKIRDGLSVEDIRAVVEEARRYDKPVFGHTSNWREPDWDYTLDAVRAGVGGIMHMVFPPVGSNRLPPQPSGAPFAGPNWPEWYLWYTSLWLHTDETAERTLIREMTTRGTWVEPTLIWDAHFVDGERYSKTMPARLDSTNFVEFLESFPQREGEAAVLHHAAVARMGEFLRRFHAAGGTVIAGTDGVFLAGWGLHEELRLLVESGLDPSSSLQAATINAARALGWEDRLGTVEVGKFADLVLLEANPLADITNTQRIVAVVSNGRFLDREALDALIPAIER